MKSNRRSFLKFLSIIPAISLSPFTFFELKKKKMVVDMKGVEIKPKQIVKVHQDEEMSTAWVVKPFNNNPTQIEPGYWVDINKGGGIEGMPSYLLEIIC